MAHISDQKDVGRRRRVISLGSQSFKNREGLGIGLMVALSALLAKLVGLYPFWFFSTCAIWVVPISSNECQLSW